MVRSWHKIASLLALAACTLCWSDNTGPAKLPFSISKETTGITSPLNADVLPDYLAAINDKFGKGVTPQENAFVAWLAVVGTKDLSPANRPQILKMCGAEESDGLRWKTYARYLEDAGFNQKLLNAAFDEEADLMKSPWSEDDHPRMAAYLKFVEASLDGTKDAFSRPKYWMPFASSDGSLVRVTLPSLSRARNAANSLLVRAMLEAHKGDFDGFLSDFLATRRIARHLGSSTTLIERLVGSAIQTAGDRALGSAAGSAVFSAAQYAQLAKQLDAIPAFPRVSDAIEILERWCILDATIRFATGQKDDLQIILDSDISEIDSDAVTWDVVLKRVNKHFDEEVAALKIEQFDEMEKVLKALKANARPHEKDELHRRDDESAAQYSERIASIIEDGMFDCSTTARIDRQAKLTSEMARALVAAAHFHADKLKWPESLRELVPAYLKAVPKDIFSKGGQSEIELVSSDKGAHVLSIGHMNAASEERKPIVIGVK